MELHSNDTEQQFLSNSEVIRSSPTEQSFQIELGELFGTSNGNSGETISDQSEIKTQTSVSSKPGSGNDTGGPPGDAGPSSPDREQLVSGTPKPKDRIWACCGGDQTCCPSNGVWLVDNTPACMDCEHRACSRCEKRVME
ncbi:unnamed protein product [Tuber melanosporum]|uniref:(Perigord truffle) hypothetical protein n=1 Tax=Tuber melanosporum (strain Mel28) TaxID=656061 RepID=D5GN27_TUBMM|nr:uncharacterized protein GSTUM_00011060001 [Tuber melanosporum]CAZ85920.1 unnamed protein product [Tuber melanosporum]